LPLPLRRGVGEGSNQKIIMEIAEVVIQTIKEAGVPMKSAEIAQKTGIDKKEIDKAIGKLKKEEKLVSPKVCYYDIKK